MESVPSPRFPITSFAKSKSFELIFRLDFWAAPMFDAESDFAVIKDELNHAALLREPVALADR